MMYKKIVFLCCIVLLTACDAGKFYAGKRINRHYETNAGQPVSVTENTLPPAEPLPVPETITMVRQHHAPAASAAATTMASQPERKQSLHVTETEKVSAPNNRLHIMPSIGQKNTLQTAGEKTLGRGLALILLGVLFLLLGLLFALTLSTPGLIFAFIFYIAAAVLVVVGIITLFL